MLNGLLFYRFMILNTMLASGVGWAVSEGWVIPLYITDTSHITIAITALFAVVLGWTLREIIRVSIDLNHAKATVFLPAHPAERDKDLAKVEWLSSAAEWMVGLGLLGTVIGFSMALSGIDQGSLASAGGVKTSVEALMRGMAVAINTTIVGAVLGLWTEINVRLLRTALATYWGGRLDAAGE